MSKSRPFLPSMSIFQSVKSLLGLYMTAISPIVFSLSSPSTIMNTAQTSHIVFIVLTSITIILYSVITLTVFSPKLASFVINSAAIIIILLILLSVLYHPFVQIFQGQQGIFTLRLLIVFCLVAILVQSNPVIISLQQ